MALDVHVTWPDWVQAIANFFIHGIVTDRGAQATDAMGIMGHVKTVLDVREKDAATIKGMAEMVVMGEVTAACALSLVPMESNFGSFFGGMTLATLLRPLVEGAIVNPWLDIMHGIFPTRHINPRMLIQGVTAGTITENELIISAARAGFIDEDITDMVKLARANIFAANTKEDFATIATYKRDALQYTIAANKIDADENIASLKLQLKDADKQLAAQATIYTPDPNVTQAIVIQANTPIALAIVIIKARITAQKKYRANIAAIVLSGEIAAAKARIALNVVARDAAVPNIETVFTLPDTTKIQPGRRGAGA